MVKCFLETNILLKDISGVKVLDFLPKVVSGLCKEIISPDSKYGAC